jgi:hypothetical protein
MRRYTALLIFAVLGSAAGCGGATNNHSAAAGPIGTAAASGFSGAPACSPPLPSILTKSASTAADGKPIIDASVGQPVSIDTQTDVQPQTPISSLQLIVAKPGTIAAAGASAAQSHSHATVADPTSHEASNSMSQAQMSATGGPARPLSVTFTPQSSGLYPVFAVERTGANGGCAAGGGSYSENVIAWVQAP